jgi:aspartyl protease family protein
MIGRALLIWSSVIVVAVNVPTMAGFVSKKIDDGAGGLKAETISVSQPNMRMYVLKSDNDGHFQGKFRLNGKSMDALVDTGATFVTLNESAARNLGYGGNDLRFRYEVTTANGKVKAARVLLKSVEIGTVSVRNVDALVIRDKSLQTTLIGMSFMKKLSSYNAADDQLRLVN